ncbi:metallophosphoesterase [Pseudomonas aeruginosa]|uniref:metallophosphoesterase n=1 Tax=Pseudomonas aeruginosa TaxID=287 RepID=UPI00071B0608|nr:metallophosphoesterase [Pseudomonas aeruginosa]
MAPHRHYVQRIPLTRGGRVFCIGDVHGAFDLVLEGMRAVRFDPQVDLLISVGDLIDRGRGSHRVAKFLRQKYVLAVLGNHEAMLIDLYAKGEPPAEALAWAARHNGFRWWLDASSETRREVLEELRKLPIALEVGTTRGTVGIVHADVPPGMCWQEFVAKLEAGDGGAIHSALWGEERIKQNDESGVNGVGRVFVGHRIQWQGMRRLGNVFAIDTGATFAEIAPDDSRGGHLTFVNVALASRELVRKPSTSTRVDHRDGAIPSEPFSLRME